jgi:predicted unusual protein kinase regulating ubiquinone biosynthesis (AarF/ABC1/UbiB family)
VLQAGQFIGARSDFVPEATCAWLRKLQDEVPPLTPPEVTTILERELAGPQLSNVFEWIDLEKPLGSASIAQVHMAKLRQYRRPPSALRRAALAPLRALGSLLGARRVPVTSLLLSALPPSRLLVWVGPQASRQRAQRSA